MEGRDVAAAVMTVVLVSAGVVLGAVVLRKLDLLFPLVEESGQQLREA